MTALLKHLNLAGSFARLFLAAFVAVFFMNLAVMLQKNLAIIPDHPTSILKIINFKRK